MDTRLIHNAEKEAAVLLVMLAKIQEEVGERRDLLAVTAVEDPEVERLFNRYQSIYTRLETGRKYYMILCDLLVETAELVERGT